jgi:hypothetical protein
MGRKAGSIGQTVTIGLRRAGETKQVSLTIANLRQGGSSSTVHLRKS